MCGICGWAHGERERLPDEPALFAINNALRHRGPDGEGVHVAPGIALGHRRLSVIDLDRGAQPMHDPSGRYTIVFNGEIYNFRGLRAELEAAGITFRTSSDTEVLLQGLIRHGTDFLSKLAGMFAFALWDAREETLLLARDRLGVKPLYWAALPDGGVAFASELQALLRHPEAPQRLDAEAIAQVAAFGYVCGERSIIEGIRPLPPASWLRWRRRTAPVIHRYWDLLGLWESREPLRAPEPELRERFLDLLDRATDARLVSDVPLGAFLSGGLDSSTVTALMRRHLPAVETFSIGFRENSFDELDWARSAAIHLGTTHFDRVLTGSDPGLLLEIAERQDEPFADTSILPTYVLSRMSRERVTVALSGDGGDELLAGYVTHQADALHTRLRHLPGPLRAALRGLAGALPDSRRKVDLVFKLKRFLGGLHLDAADAHAWWRTQLAPDALARLFGRPVWGEALLEPFRRAHREAARLHPLDRFLYVDYRTWLPNDILVKVDRASMAHGLEVRSPFLDHRLVEFCMGLAPRLKRRGGSGKLLLKRAASGLIPQRHIRRSKSGFNAPVAHWLAREWRDVTEGAFASDALGHDGGLDGDQVRALYREHLSSRRDHGYVLFSLLMLSFWIERWRKLRARPGAGRRTDDAAPRPRAVTWRGREAPPSASRP